MTKKLKNYLLKLLFGDYGAILLSFSIMVLLSVFNLINTVFFSSTIWGMLLFVLLAFVPPLAIFIASRTQKYFPTLHLGSLKKYHIPTIVYSFFLLIFGSVMLKFIFFDEQYTTFSLYNAFFAELDGGLLKKIYLFFSFCVLPPILEGIVYRGILIKQYDVRGRLTSSVVSSLLFALLGFNINEIPQRFFMGVVLCIVLYATSSILISVTIHILYNIFALCFEPIFVSLKNISANASAFLLLILIATLIMATCLCSHLCRLYHKYSRDKNYNNFKRSTPRERTFWHVVELFISAPAIACYVFFITAVIIMNI